MIVGPRASRLGKTGPVGCRCCAGWARQASGMSRIHVVPGVGVGAHAVSSSARFVKRCSQAGSDVTKGGARAGLYLRSQRSGSPRRSARPVLGFPDREYGGRGGCREDSAARRLAGSRWVKPLGLLGALQHRHATDVCIAGRNGESQNVDSLCRLFWDRSGSLLTTAAPAGSFPAARARGKTLCIPVGAGPSDSIRDVARAKAWIALKKSGRKP